MSHPFTVEYMQEGETSFKDAADKQNTNQERPEEHDIVMHCKRSDENVEFLLYR